VPSVGGREEGGLGLAGWNILCLDVGGATAWSAELRDGHVGGVLLEGATSCGRSLSWRRRAS